MTLQIERNISYLITTSIRQNFVNMYDFNVYDIACKLNHFQQSQIIRRAYLLDALINHLKFVFAIFIYFPKRKLLQKFGKLLFTLLKSFFRPQIFVLPHPLLTTAGLIGEADRT